MGMFDHVSQTEVLAFLRSMGCDCEPSYLDDPEHEDSVHVVHQVDCHYLVLHPDHGWR